MVLVICMKLAFVPVESEHSYVAYARVVCCGVSFWCSGGFAGPTLILGDFAVRMPLGSGQNLHVLSFQQVAM